MENFTPVSALVGGAMIGAAAALLLVLTGRIAGISGILGGALEGRGADDTAWRIAFLAGLVAAPLVYAGLGATLPPVTVATPLGLLALAGVLVGYGSRLGGGCTSGHGVCGISRASPRSLAATAVFMAVAAVTVFFTRHVLGM